MLRANGSLATALAAVISQTGDVTGHGPGLQLASTSCLRICCRSDGWSAAVFSRCGVLFFFFTFGLTLVLNVELWEGGLEEPGKDLHTEHLCRHVRCTRALYSGPSHVTRYTAVS